LDSLPSNSNFDFNLSHLVVKPFKFVNNNMNNIEINLSKPRKRSISFGNLEQLIKFNENDENNLPIINMITPNNNDDICYLPKTLKSGGIKRKSVNTSLNMPIEITKNKRKSVGFEINQINKLKVNKSIIGLDPVQVNKRKSVGVELKNIVKRKSIGQAIDIINKKRKSNTSSLATSRYKFSSSQNISTWVQTERKYSNSKSLKYWDIVLIVIRFVYRMNHITPQYLNSISEIDKSIEDYTSNKSKSVIKETNSFSIIPLNNINENDEISYNNSMHFISNERNNTLDIIKKAKYLF